MACALRRYGVTDSGLINAGLENPIARAITSSLHCWLNLLLIPEFTTIEQSLFRVSLYGIKGNNMTQMHTLHIAQWG
ncbi:MAG: hypothetical protein P8X89_21575 [Reinekea sp.]